MYFFVCECFFLCIYLFLCSWKDVFLYCMFFGCGEIFIMLFIFVCEDYCFVWFVVFCGFGFKNWKLGVCKVYGSGDGRVGEIWVVLSGVNSRSYFYNRDFSIFIGLVWRSIFCFFFILFWVCYFFRLFIDLLLIFFM